MNVTTNGKLFPLWDVDIDQTALRLEVLFDVDEDLKGINSKIRTF